MSKIYYFTTKQNGADADIYIFGDIVTPEWEGWGGRADVSAHSLVSVLSALEADTIRVHINSYGGHVSEGLAILNSLAAHPAKIITFCTGFACSAASVVFMAGDDRFMYPASLLMIHNAWNAAVGTAEDLRKAAEDLDIVSQTAANAYKGRLNIDDDALSALLDAETWIPPDRALEWGFATGILRAPVTEKASASVRGAVFRQLTTGEDPRPQPQKNAVNSLAAFFNVKNE